MEQKEISLSPAQRRVFEKNIRKGVFHALYQRGMLTAGQWNFFLEENRDVLWKKR